MAGFTENFRALTRSQKSSRGVSLYSRFVNRPLGRVFAAAAHAIGLSPNAVTLVSAIVSAAGIALIATVPATPLAGVAIAVLLVLGFALDSADGQVARLTGSSSATGEWLDHVVDAGKIVALHSCVAIGAARFLPVPDGWLLFAFGFQLVAVVTFARGVLFDLLVAARPGAAAAPAGGASTARALALLPADYGVLALSFVFWGVPQVFALWYPLLFIANAVIMVLLLGKTYRALRAFDRTEQN